MASKSVLSIYLDGVELKSVVARLSGGKIEVEAFDRATLITSLKQPVEEEELAEGEPELESADDVFGVEEEEASAPDEDPFAAAEAEEEAEDEAESMVGEGSDDEDEGETSNEDILLSLIRRAPGKKFNYAINLPAPITSAFQLRNGFADMKAGELRKRVAEEVNERVGAEVPADHVKFVRGSDDSIVIFSYKGSVPLINACDGIESLLDAKPRFVLVEPDIVSILNFIRFDDTPSEEEVVAIIDIEDDESRIIVTKGGNFLHMAPPIREGVKSPSVLNTIYSKILYEQDVGNLPDFDRVILSGEAEEIGAKEFLEENLGDTKVEYLAVNSDKIVVPGDLLDKVASYAIPLGMAIRALQPKAKELLHTNLLPDYVKSRQRAFKLAWHGMLTLLLILSVPFAFDYQNKKKSKTLREATTAVANLNRSIVDLEGIQPLIDSLAFHLELSDSRMALIDSLAKGSLRWSVTLARVDRAMREVNGVWLTDLNSRQDGIQLSGFSLYRNRVPRFAALFADASILSVTPATIRGKDVYRFSLQVSSVTDDISEFNPIVEIPEIETPEPEPPVIEPEPPVVEAEAPKEEEAPVVEEKTPEPPIVEAEPRPTETPAAERRAPEAPVAEAKPPETAAPIIEEKTPEPRMEKPSETVVKERAVAGTSVSLTTLPSSYRRGLGHYERGDYDRALSVFQMIASAKLKHPLTDNAQYWMAECYLALGRSAQAAESLEILLIDYPATNKRAPALVLLGRAYSQLGRISEARQALNRVLQDHPKSEFIYKARRLMATLSKN